MIILGTTLACFAIAANVFVVVMKSTSSEKHDMTLNLTAITGSLICLVFWMLPT